MTTPTGKTDLQADLTADLVADLGRPAPLPSATPLAPLPDLPVDAGTPALGLTLTPLRWARPGLAPTSTGTGVAVRLGPWRLELAL